MPPAAEAPAILGLKPPRRQIARVSRLLLLLLFLKAWLPGFLGYGVDLLWLWLAVLAVRFSGWRGFPGGALWIVTFLALSAGIYLCRFQNGLYFLWGLRNNFRFYAAFFAFLLLTEGERRDIASLLEGLFWVNAALSLIQFARGFRGDFLGGLFGTEKGCNGSTTLFLLVMVVRGLVLTLEGQKSPGFCLGYSAAALLLAALAELKFFFLAYLLALLLAALLCRRSGRLICLAGGAVLAALAVGLLYRIFPEFAGWFTPEQWLRTAAAPTGYAAQGDLNRLTAIRGINARVFTSPWQRIFGLGLGNCDYASVSVLTTPFYRLYEPLHYTWMSHAFWYLEGGWVGLTFFFSFFLLAAIRGLRLGGAEGKCAAILGLLSLLVGIYNASLRTEAAFLLYFALAVPGRKRP